MNLFPQALIIPAVGLAAAVGLFSPASGLAATIQVTSNADVDVPTVLCTLRTAIRAINTGSVAGSGCVNSGGPFGSNDLINFDASVSLIALADVANNELHVTASALQIDGGMGGVRIERPLANANMHRLINHTGTGILILRHLTLFGGRAGLSGGGGVRSSGDLQLIDSTLTENATLCTDCPGGGAYSAMTMLLQGSVVTLNETSGPGSSGGGLYAASTINISSSELSYNATYGILSHGGGSASGNGVGAGMYADRVYIVGNATGHPSAHGGGAYMTGALSMNHSWVAENSTSGYGGGIHVTSGAGMVEGSTFTANSTVGNLANAVVPLGGALYLASTTAPHTLSQSTFTGNQAYNLGIPGYGGAVFAGRRLALYNTTLSGNSSQIGGAIAITQPNPELTLVSSIVANSSTDGAGSSGPNVDIYSFNTFTATGDHSLVESTQNVTVPSGTLNADPQLASAADNGCALPAGAPTLTPVCPPTAALQVGSAAIDTGSNPTPWTYDQRGAGFPRTLGAATDIGAYERAATAAGPWAIATSVTPSGAGTLTCTPNPVADGGTSTCVATPTAGYVFSQFGGDCSGVSCVLSNVTSARSVSATFVVQPAGSWSIATSVTPAGAGTLTCTPNPVSNGGSSTCVATPIAGYAFNQFSGDCSGSTCTLNNVTGPRSVTATFAPVSPTGAQPVPALGLIPLLLLASLMLGLGLARSRQAGG